MRRSVETAMVAVTALAVHVGTPHDAYAQAPSGEQVATAQVLFDQAIEEMTNGKPQEACPKFRRSFDLDPKSSTLGNLGACYEATGQTGSAWAAYQELSAYARVKGRSEWATKAEERIAALNPKLIRLLIRVPAALPDRFRLTRDGRVTTRDEWKIPLVIDPGKHVLGAEAQGYVPWRTEVDCSEGSKTYTVDVPPLAKLPDPPSSAPLRRTLGFVSMGVGAGALVAGGVFGLRANSIYSDVERNCALVPGSDTQCSQRLDRDRLGRANGLATASTIFFVAGGVLAAGGLLLALTAKSPSRVAIAPSVGPGNAGLLLTGRWQ
jgi:hypothetical protein